MSQLFENLSDDLRFSLRALRRQRAYTAASVLTLALGIGATSAVFAVIDATLVRPLPYREPARLVGLNAVGIGPDGTQTAYSPSQIELVRWQVARRSFESIEAIEPRALALTGDGEPEVVAGGIVSSGLFPMLGSEPRLGRTFTADEERIGAPLAVISDGLWRRRYAADPATLGRTVTLDGRSYEIVGIMPPGFHPLLIVSDVWVPLRAVVDPARQNLRLMSVAGRLRSGVTTAQAERELAAISADVAKEFPTSHGQMRPRVIDLRQQLLGGQRPPF